MLTGPDLTGFVDPFIGTQGEGNVIPGPAVPRGMVKLSPDRTPDFGLRSGRFAVRPAGC